nr:MAG TPA: hypothetical protein [Caudoviricetes sp.]
MHWSFYWDFSRLWMFLKVIIIIFVQYSLI